MSDATPQKTEPSKLGRLASWGLLAGTAVAAVYVALPVLAYTIPVIASHLITTAVLAGGAAALGYAKKDKLGGVKNFFSNTAKLYKQAFDTARSDWKLALSWGKAKAAERTAETSAPQAPANDAGASKLAGAASKGAFNGVTAKTADITPAEATPAPKKTAGLGL